jgi:hypothetical protein
MLRVSDAGRSRRCGLHRGRRPKAFNERNRGKWVGCKEHGRQRPRSVVSRPQQSSLYWALKCILQIVRPAILVPIVLAKLLEPPCTDPYARWCGRGGAARLPPIPIVDPYRTFDRDSKKAHCDARYLGRLEIIDLESGSAKCIAEHSWLPVAAQPWRRSRPQPAVRTCCLQEIGRHRRTRLSSGSQT